MRRRVYLLNDKTGAGGGSCGGGCGRASPAAAATKLAQFTVIVAKGVSYYKKTNMEKKVANVATM